MALFSSGNRNSRFCSTCSRTSTTSDSTEKTNCNTVHHWQFCNPEETRDNCNCQALAIGQAIADALHRSTQNCENNSPAAASTAYGTIYSQTPRGVNRGCAVLFDDISCLSGIGLNDEGTQLQIEQKGVYLLSFQLQIVSGAGGAAAIRRNGKVLSGTRVDLENNTANVSCTIISSFESEDSLELLILDRDVSLACGTNASLTLVKIA